MVWVSVKKDTLQRRENRDEERERERKELGSRREKNPSQIFKP